ncbi:3-oxoacyl-[acyl-carrier-protein] reductase FabG [Penicillium brevicompactum]|uniref:short chain type dehydrogenase n=1 Tax=Penicillium brevicompactum TaxID=5074 RepID=UPI002541B45C|nr:short chain type dehydrogenase [Penicillium brevicompactum]KAJ5347635.1 short chain type dehydrogenase [Penicillium brevicompactum]
MSQTNVALYSDLKDKIALVIGAGQSGDPTSRAWGNGAAIAKALGSSGAKVIASDVSLEAAQRTASRIQAEGGFCEAIQLNATLSSDIKRAVNQLVETHHRIDILINNVGLTKTGDPATMSEEAWDAQFQLNLKTTFLTCNAILPIMEKQGSGSIVNNASIAGMKYLGKPQIAYASAKAAVIHFSKITGVMYASKGVRVNSVSPGMVFTPLLEKLGASELPEERETYRKIMDHNVPMGIMGDAFDVANAVTFLASCASRYVVGQNLVVDGGLTESTGTGERIALAKI